MTPSLLWILRWKEPLMTMAIWNDYEYLVANLTNKTDYATAEICKFNSCLCILSSSAGIIFFLTVVLKGLVQTKLNLEKLKYSQLFYFPFKTEYLFQVGFGSS